MKYESRKDKKNRVTLFNANQSKIVVLEINGAIFVNEKDFLDYLRSDKGGFFRKDIEEIFKVACLVHKYFFLMNLLIYK